MPPLDAEGFREVAILSKVPCEPCKGLGWLTENTGSPAIPAPSDEGLRQSGSRCDNNEPSGLSLGAAERVVPNLGSVALIIFGVFSADGCECEFLEGLFSTEQLARDFADQLKRDPYVYGNPELVSVKPLEVNAVGVQKGVGIQH